MVQILPRHKYFFVQYKEVIATEPQASSPQHHPVLSQFILLDIFITDFIFH
jgi:hypothetical protein